MKAFKTLTIASVSALLSTALMLLPGSARADAKGAATRQLALSRDQGVTTALESSAASAQTKMSCAKCTDSKAVAAEVTHKASHPVVKHVVSTHNCSTCETKMVSIGHGKMATTKAAHTCDLEPKGCCATE